MSPIQSVDEALDAMGKQSQGRLVRVDGGFQGQPVEYRGAEVDCLCK